MRRRSAPSGVPVRAAVLTIAVRLVASQCSHCCGSCDAWDTTTGLIAEDDGLGTANYFDPTSLASFGSVSTDNESWYLSDMMAPDGSWITTRGNGPVDCATAHVRRVSLTGTLFDATMQTILGLGTGQDCVFGGAVVTTAGDIVVLASDSQQTYLASKRR